MKVTFEIDAQRKYVSHCIEILEEESVVLEELEKILLENAGCRKDADELGSWGYFFRIGDQRRDFAEDLSVVINALLERFESKIKEVSSAYLNYAYQFEGLKYLGDSCYSSWRVSFYDRYVGEEEEWKYVNTIENGRFFDLFANPLYGTAAILEGTIRFDDEPESEKMTWFANPIADAYQGELQGGQPRAGYSGTVQLYDWVGTRICTIKGKFAAVNLSNFLGVTEIVQLNPALYSLYLLSYFLMDLLEIQYISCQGTALRYYGSPIELYSSDQKEKIYYNYENNDIPLEQVFNAFLRYRNREENILNRLFTYVRGRFGEQNIRQWIFYPGQNGKKDVLVCDFRSECELCFQLDRENVEEPIRGARLHFWVREEEAENCRLIELELPYVYGYKGNYIQENPTVIRVYEQEEPEGEPLLRIEDEASLNWICGYLEEMECTLPSLCEADAREDVEEFCEFLFVVNAEVPEDIAAAGNEEPVNLQERVQQIFGKDRNYFPDANVLRSICLELADYLCWKYREDDTGGKEQPTLPNLAFLGGPGSGKTSIIRRLARDVLGAKFYETTPSDLKGMYVGHTRGVFLDKIDQLQRQEDFGREAPAILFLDEAYTLFGTNGQQESFAKDIIALLLTIMQRGEKKFAYQLEEYDESGKQITVNKTVTVKPNTVVWMAGYEKEMRKALSSNPGIFRRVTSIVLPDPTIEDLWRCFQTAMREMDREDQQLVEGIKKEILDFFRWGVTREHAEFFGNYAGAKRLAANMLNTLLLLGKETPKEQRERELLFAIDAQKKEIRRQYKIVISDDKRLPFEVISDLEENLDDYIGNDSVRELMREIVDMMVNSEIYKKRHVSIPRGALLMGYPGTGKTYLAKCMAGELAKELRVRNSDKKIAFIPVGATELRDVEMISALFSAAEEYEAGILFIDEIDAIGKNRYLVNDPGPLIQLMKEMDGFDTRKTLFVLAATNAPESLDPALKRAGRFDMQFEIRRPNRQDRKELLRYHTGKILPDAGEDFLESAAAAAYEMAPADIKEAVNEAALLYYRCENKLRNAQVEDPLFLHRAVKTGENFENTQIVTVGRREYWIAADPADGIAQELFLCDLKEVLEKKRMGERLTERIPEEVFQTDGNFGRSAIAIHEVGHALVYAWLGYRIEKITVLGRGMALGYVKSQSASCDTKKHLLDQIKAALGGRVAEEIFYGDDNISMGASSDISNATQMARSMVARYGMGDSVGVMALLEDQGSYLEHKAQYTCSEAYREKADNEVQKVLEEQIAQVREYLGGCKEQIRMLAEYVFDREEVSGEVFLEKCREFGI